MLICIIKNFGYVMRNRHHHRHHHHQPINVPNAGAQAFLIMNYPQG
jgi:hypothetical protein